MGGFKDALKWAGDNPRLASAGLMLTGNILAATMASRAKRQAEEDARDRARANWSVGNLQTSWRR